MLQEPRFKNNSSVMYQMVHQISNRPVRGRQHIFTVKDVKFVKINSLRFRRKTKSLLTGEFNVKKSVKDSLATI